MGQAQSQERRENSAREQQPCGESAAAEAVVPAGKESDRAGQAPPPPGGCGRGEALGGPLKEGEQCQEVSQKRGLRRRGLASHGEGPAKALGYERRRANKRKHRPLGPGRWAWWGLV